MVELVTSIYLLAIHMNKFAIKILIMTINTYIKSGEYKTTFKTFTNTSTPYHSLTRQKYVN